MAHVQRISVRLCSDPHCTTTASQILCNAYNAEIGPYCYKHAPAALARLQADEERIIAANGILPRPVGTKV
jgi:hypothetical protein